MLRALAPRALVAFSNREAAVDGPHWRADEHEVLRWCRLMIESGCRADPDDILVDAEPHPGAPVDATMVHPGAKSGSRRWPADRWIDVVRAETEAGRVVVVTGTEPERALVRHIIDHGDPAHVQALVGADVMTFAAHVAAAGRVLCGDTGVAHLATALGRPSVSLFGPMSPALWGPLRDLDRHIVLWTGRTGDALSDDPDPGLLEISVDDVTDAIARLHLLDSDATLGRAAGSSPRSASTPSSGEVACVPRAGTCGV